MLADDFEAIQAQVPPGSEWLFDLVLDGFTKLIACRLPSTPAHDTMPVVALVWLEALLHARRFREDADAERLRTAFVALEATSEAWPSPAKLLGALEPTAVPTTFVRLPPPATIPEWGDTSPAAVEARRAHLARILAEKG